MFHLFTEFEILKLKETYKETYIYLIRNSNPKPPNLTHLYFLE